VAARRGARGLYASKIKESMMMETPEEAIERLCREMRKAAALASPLEAPSIES
jgi:hypothetical protein